MLIDTLAFSLKASLSSCEKDTKGNNYYLPPYFTGYPCYTVVSEELPAQSLRLIKWPDETRPNGRSTHATHCYVYPADALLVLCRRSAGY